MESLDQLYQCCTSSLQRIGRKHKGEQVVVIPMVVSLDQYASGLALTQSLEGRCLIHLQTSFACLMRNGP
ncbi:hypothetical protein DITRI_Ditri09bG0107200 [Diplodiscus trichospermus]